MVAEQADQQSTRGGFTRGAFPRMKLKLAEDLARVIHEVGSGERARLITVLNRVDRKPTSGPTKTLLTSAGRGYGLINGSASDTHLSLTERGTALVTAASDIDRYVVAFDALQQNDVFRAFVDKFKHRTMPSDEVAADFLKEKFDFSDSDATAATKVIKQNLNDYGLTETVGEREVIVPPDEVLQAFRSTTGSETPPTEQDATEQQERATSTVSAPVRRIVAEAESLSDIAPQIAFNIQIQLPSDASPETYDAIFRNIATHLLRRSSE